MSELPFGWTSCTVGELIDCIETGKSVKCDERPPIGSEKGLVKISAVTWGEFDEEESKTLLDDAHLKPNEKIHQGDLLISRANTLELVGSCVLVKSISKNLYLSDKVLRLVLADQTKPWLLTCLKTRDGRRQIESLATGNQLSMRNISQQAIREIKVPLPPLAEQIRIAQKLEELLAQVDTLKARIDAIPALLKRFRQSVLMAAVSGGISSTAYAHSLRLSDICLSITDGDHQAPPQSKEGIPFITISAINDGVIRLEKATRYVQASYFHELKDSRKPQIGDILFSVTGSICIPAMVLNEEAFTFQRHIAILRPNTNLALQKFLYFYLSSELIKKQGLDVATGTAQLTVPLKSLRNFDISLPSLEEQTEIVRRVEQLFAFADQLEAKVASAKSRIDHLTQSILAKAFCGELVPQDPNDEPASVLLERIKAQRTAAPKAKRGRKASV